MDIKTTNLNLQYICSNCVCHIFHKFSMFLKAFASQCLAFFISIQFWNQPRLTHPASILRTWYSCSPASSPPHGRVSPTSRSETRNLIRMRTFIVTVVIMWCVVTAPLATSQAGDDFVSLHSSPGFRSNILNTSFPIHTQHSTARHTIMIQIASR